MHCVQIPFQEEKKKRFTNQYFLPTSIGPNTFQKEGEGQGGGGKTEKGTKRKCRREIGEGNSSSCSSSSNDGSAKECEYERRYSERQRRGLC